MLQVGSALSYRMPTSSLRVMSPASSSSLRDGCRIFFRQRRKIAWVFCSIVLVVVGVLALWPRTYRSEAKLFVRLGRENMAIDPTATLGQPSTLTMPASRENELNSLVEM